MKNKKVKLLSLLMIALFSIDLCAGGPPPLDDYYYQEGPTKFYANRAGCVMYREEDLSVSYGLNKETAKGQLTAHTPRKESNFLTTIMNQAYNNAEQLQSIDRNSMQQFLQSLQTVPQADVEELLLDGLLHGKSKASATFHQKLINKLAIHMNCERMGEMSIDDSVKKEYLVAAYLGTPSALELLKHLDPTCAAAQLSYILDAKKITKIVKIREMVADNEACPSGKPHYIWRETDRTEKVVTDERFGQTLQKFPEPTVQFVKNYFKQQCD